MKLQIKAVLDRGCVEFIRRKLEGFDTRKLEYMRLYDRTDVTSTHGVWGRCTYPDRKKELGYRIRCCVSIPAGKFPFPAKWAVGTRQLGDGKWEWVWRHDWFGTKTEAFVWLAGHEAFHWLRHSRQIPGSNYETQANRYGFAWLDKWRRSVPSTMIRTHSEPTSEKQATDDTSFARIFICEGRNIRLCSQTLAYALWLGLPRGIRAAFRGARDRRPVYPWDYADML